MDIAKELLANVEAEPTQKAMALHAFEVAPHERALKGMLDRINIPLAAKADLWDAKKNSSINPKMHKILDLANLPTDLLDKAESHPNVLKALLMEDKPSEAKSSPKASEKPPKAQEAGNKEAAAGKEDGQEQEEEQKFGTNPANLPPIPWGHVHFMATDGSEHYVPHEKLGQVAQLDPGIKVLRTNVNGEGYAQQSEQPSQQ